MSNRMIPVLLLTATLYALGAGVAGLSHQPAASIAAPVVQAIPMLPTVTVRPDADDVLTLLPTVLVRPGPAEIAAAKALDSGAAGTGAVVVVMHTLGGGSLLARPSFDMPYYSFGRSASRVSKE